MTEFRGTTICAVKKDGVTAIAGDGQVTMGESVIFKTSAVKVRRIYGGKVILGFAGSVTDAFSLSERFEGMLNKFAGNLMRSAVELADLWRSDKIGRKLDAMMITADANTLLIISGTGEVIEPDGGICAIAAAAITLCGGSRAVCGDGIRRGDDCEKGAENRVGNLRIYQRQYTLRNGGRSPAPRKGRGKAGGEKAPREKNGQGGRINGFVTQTDRQSAG